MIEARGLTKRYGAKTAVDDISFTVEPGQVTGFLGPNGAGKSTTMPMIARIAHSRSTTPVITGFEAPIDLRMPISRVRSRIAVYIA